MLTRYDTDTGAGHRYDTPAVVGGDVREDQEDIWRGKDKKRTHLRPDLCNQRKRMMTKWKPEEENLPPEVGDLSCCFFSFCNPG